LVLKAAAPDVPAVTLNYGLFINTVIDFFIVAVAIFIVVRGINLLKKKDK
jgi:large conductance mechanosensitive channel